MDKGKEHLLPFPPSTTEASISCAFVKNQKAELKGQVKI